VLALDGFPVLNALPAFSGQGVLFWAVDSPWCAFAEVAAAIPTAGAQISGRGLGKCCFLMPT
jgi:hypothetical protein